MESTDMKAAITAAGAVPNPQFQLQGKALAILSDFCSQTKTNSMTGSTVSDCR